MLGRNNNLFSWVQDAKRIGLGFFFCLAIAVALYYLYDLAACYESEVYWLGAATVNSIITAFVLFFHRKTLFQTRSSSLPPSRIDFLPLLLGAGCLVLAFMSYLLGHSEQRAVDWQDWLWVLWIPFVEEVTFRVGFGQYFRKKMGLWWGAYFSVLLFCLAHTMGAYFYEPLKWFTAIPLGVVLLGITCEFLYIWRQRLWLIVLFHMSANFSVVLFKSIDSRWLHWLRMFYSN